ncbi:unnamed protein product, partial [marine sediment metagenome]
IDFNGGGLSFFKERYDFTLTAGDNLDLLASYSSSADSGSKF